MTLKRSVLALGAAALMTASLTACGGSDDASGAPTDASKSDFCSAEKALVTSVGDANDENAFTALQAAATHLKEVGTPSDIPADARAGYEVVVDAILKTNWQDVKNSLDGDSFPGVSGEDKTKAASFGTWVNTECPS